MRRTALRHTAVTVLQDDSARVSHRRQPGHQARRLPQFSRPVQDPVASHRHSVRRDLDFRLVSRLHMAADFHLRQVRSGTRSRRLRSEHLSADRNAGGIDRRRSAGGSVVLIDQGRALYHRAGRIRAGCAQQLPARLQRLAIRYAAGRNRFRSVRRIRHLESSAVGV
jgi:hypothetical protein